MKKLYFTLLLAGLFGYVKSQYTTIYETSFTGLTRNQSIGGGWVTINNDTITKTPVSILRAEYAGVFPPHPLETINPMFGFADSSIWDYYTPIREVAGQCDKIIMTPPLTLGNDPYAVFYSMYKGGSHLDAWVVANPNDTTISGLTTKVLSCNKNGFNSINLNNWANTTIRLALRLTGTDTYCLFDDLKVINKTSLADIPDSCFRAYLHTVVNSAFIGEQLDFLSPVVLNTISLSCPNSCIQSLEGLQYFPGVHYLNFSNNNISYIPLNPLYYLDTINLSNNALTVVPDMPGATIMYFRNNMITRIPNIWNNVASVFDMKNNMLYDCLPGTNRFVHADFSGNIGVTYGGTYYSFIYDGTYNDGPTNCKYNKGTINGIVYFDANQNSNYDTGDIPIPHQRINFQQVDYLYSSTSGKYGAYADTGNINMSITSLPSYFNCTNPLATHVEDQEIIKHNFRVIPTATVNDLGVSVTPFRNSVDTSAKLQLQINVHNYGTHPQNAVVKMYIPHAYTTINTGSASMVNDTLVWNLYVRPFETVSDSVSYFNTYKTALTVSFFAKVLSTSDINPVNDTSLCQVLITDIPRPRDPNNKVVNTPQVAPGFSSYLYYTINFENVGLGNATRVSVRDYLSHKFDYTSLEVLGASHPYEIGWGHDSVIQFTFYPITLTPKSLDSVHSHGAIWYRIKPAQPILSGQSIGNYAAIYFDSEAPVKTDTVLVWAGALHAAMSVKDTLQCGQAKVSFTDVSPGTGKSRQWIFDKGTPATSAIVNPTVRYDSSGNYKVTLIVRANEYTDTLVRFIKVLTDSVPVAKITASKANVCLGDSIQLTANFINGNTYLWNTGQTTISIYAKTGSYYVDVIRPSGCSSRAYNNYLTPITLTPVISDTSSCQSPTAYLTLSTTYPFYLWSTGATTRSVTVNQYKQYTVQVSDTNGCVGRDTFDFAYHAKPTVIIAGDTLICDNKATLLRTAQNFSTYKWSYNNSTTPTVSVYTAATYTLTVSDEFGCTGTGSFILKTKPATYVYLTGEYYICKGDTATINATAGFTKYFWSTSETTPSIKVRDGDTYSVSATSANGCVSSNNRTLNVLNKYNLMAKVENAGICPGDSIKLNGVYNRGPLTAPAAGCSQQTATMGTGSTAESYTYGFLSNYTQSIRYELLFKASELRTQMGGAKLITKIAFQMSSIGGAAPLKNFSIKMGHSTDVFPNFLWAPDIAEVYYTASFQPVVGWGNSFTLTRPFYWDGVSDVIVDICSYNSTPANVGNKAVTTTTTLENYMYSTSSTDICSDISLGSRSGGFSRPNVRFDYCTPLTTPVPVYTPTFKWTSVGGTANINNPLLASTTATANVLSKFIVVVTDDKGCSDADSAWALAGTIPPVITESNHVLSTTVQGNYQWYLNGDTIAGAHSATHVASSEGIYKLLVTDGTGCQSFSNTIYLISTGLSQASTPQAQVRVYPNPSSGKVNIDINKPGLKQVNISITDLMGQQLYSHKEISQSDHYTKQFDLNLLAGGVYFINVEADGQNNVQKIVYAK